MFDGRLHSGLKQELQNAEGQHGRRECPSARRRSECRESRAAYVHVPFCRHRCGYCNFTLVAGRDDLIEPYLRRIGTRIGCLASRARRHAVLRRRHAHASCRRTLQPAAGHRAALVSAGDRMRIQRRSQSRRHRPSDDRAAGRAWRESHQPRGQSFDADKLELLERDH